MKLRLKVDLNGTTYTYDNDDLAEGNLRRTEELRDREIEMGSAELGIPGSFLGATTFSGLPGSIGDVWRALLETEDGDELINGVIYRDEVDYVDEGPTWGVTIKNAAQKEFWRRLEAVSMRLLSSGAEALLQTRYDTAQGLVSHLVEEGRTEWGRMHCTWYTLTSLCEAAIEDAEDVTAAPFSMWSYSVDYNDGGTVKTITREAEPCLTSPHVFQLAGAATPDDDFMPTWSGREVIELAQVLCGWRIRASYDPFPAPGITVDFISDAWSDEPGLPELDGLEADAIGYRTVSPELDDFGVAYLNEIGEPSYEHTPVHMADRWGIYHKINYAVAVPPPPHAVYAASNWRIEAARQRGETPRTADNEALEEIPVRLAQILMSHSDDWFGQNFYNTDTITPDPANHPNYTEEVYFGTPIIEPGVEAVYLAAFETVTFYHDEDSTTTDERAVYARAPSSTVPSEQTSPVNEIWAPTIFENYSFSAQPRIGIDSRFDIRGLDLEVGARSGGVKLGGLSRLVTSLSQDLNSGFADLDLQRPTNLEVETDAPSVVGVPLNLRGEFYDGVPLDFSGTLTGDDFVALRWEPPIASDAKVLFYEIEYDNPSLGWVEVSAFFATEAYVALDSSDAPFGFRIRAVFGRVLEDAGGPFERSTWANITVRV